VAGAGDEVYTAPVDGEPVPIKKHAGCDAAKGVEAAGVEAAVVAGAVFTAVVVAGAVLGDATTIAG
jgi:hypothetical protein